MLVRYLTLSLAVAAAGCSSTTGPPPADLPARPGLAVVEASGTVAQASARLATALNDAEGVAVVAEIDHARNAGTVSQSLRPTRVTLFGNPVLGTPLIQANQLAGLDLPQKMLVYEDEDGRTLVAYNTTGYLAARHGIGGLPVLSTLATALDEFAQAAAGGEAEVQATGAESVAAGQGIVTVASDADAGTTYDRLRQAIVSNRAITVAAEIDHQFNASRVGLTLRPTRLIVFGNPALGTPLMRASQTVGIDLPQSMLVYQPASGPVRVAYEDPGFLAERHGIPASTPEIEQIRTALRQLADAAASTF